MRVQTTVPPLILAVDPGATSGWSIFCPGDEGYTLTRYGLVRQVTGTKAARIIRRAIKARPDVSVPMLLVIERSYIARPEQKKRSEVVLSSAGIEALILNRARWQIVAEFFPCEVEIRPVKPQQWQTPIIGAGRGVKRAERKRRAKKVAESYFPGALFTTDEADAVCLGLYEARLQILPVCQAGHPQRGERL